MHLLTTAADNPDEILQHPHRLLLHSDADEVEKKPGETEEKGGRFSVSKVVQRMNESVEMKEEEEELKKKTKF